jgi:hypothetical protein
MKRRSIRPYARTEARPYGWLYYEYRSRVRQPVWKSRGRETTLIQAREGEQSPRQ